MQKEGSAKKYFFLALFFLGINHGILNSTFNNFVYDVFSLNASKRGFLEFPRELPGFLLVFITFLLTNTSLKIWSVFVGLCAALGIFGMSHLSPNINVMIIWMFIWSLGDHLYMVVEPMMGLKFSNGNGEGRMLGKVSAFRNLALIVGSLLVFLCLKKLNMNYSSLYFIAVFTATLAAILFFKMNLEKEKVKPKKIVVKKKYTLYYLMNLLWGVRKQLFLTFGPWLLVAEFKVPADTIALLFFIASALGLVFRQYFGIAVDKFGEKAVLTFDALFMVAICIVFAYSDNVYLLYSAFIIDNLMFSTRIARTTYLNKIIDDKSELSSTISMGITLDHLVSMIIPFAGGLIWEMYGYKTVFLLAILIALGNLATSLKIRV